jgi:threonine dehydratase
MTAADTRADGLTAASIERAAGVIAEVARETPVLSTRTMSERAGTTIVLKAENLQRTGSFKLRGALAKIDALERSGEPIRGVVCGSAGNHAQAVAYAARAKGIPCEVFMPTIAPIAKTEAATALGAKVRLVGATVDDAVGAAQAHAVASGMAFIHPFNDLDVIAGQGTLGLELLAQIPDLSRVVVPIGGGGLISGTALAIKSQRPDIEVIGVQVESCAQITASLEAGTPVAVSKPLSTIADGIAVKRPGELTLALIGRWVDEVLTVSEDQTAEAMVFLLERAKLVVEGAGAVGVAAALNQMLPERAGATAIVLSGGNVDAGLLAQITRRHETQAGRRLVIGANLPDQPGSMARLLKVVADSNANLLDVVHQREGRDLHIRETAVQLVLETRGPEHAAAVADALRAAGYNG